MSWDLIPSVRVEQARAGNSREALARSFRGAGLHVDDQLVAEARATHWWRSKARIIGMVDSLHWLLPYLR